MSKLTVDEDGKEEKECDKNDEDISIEDAHPAVPSPIEALAAIRQLDRSLRKNNKNQNMLYSPTKFPQHVLKKIVTKPKKIAMFLRGSI